MATIDVLQLLRSIVVATEEQSCIAVCLGMFVKMAIHGSEHLCQILRSHTGVAAEARL